MIEGERKRKCGNEICQYSEDCILKAYFERSNFPHELADSYDSLSAGCSEVDAILSDNENANKLIESIKARRELRR